MSRGGMLGKEEEFFGVIEYGSIRKAKYMGSLRNLATDDVHVLEAHNLIGRSLQCSLAVKSKFASNEHASIDWIDNGWYVRDLGATNGTYIDNDLVKPRSQRKCRAGQIISIGDTGEQLKLVESSPPCPMIISVGSSPKEVRTIEHGAIVLPSIENPEVSLYPVQKNLWALEQDGNQTTLNPGTYFSACGTTWRLSVPGSSYGTSLNRGQLSLDNAEIEFYVSQDEETVEVCVKAGRNEIWMPNRSHNYMLLTLARQRLEDEDDEGWVLRDRIMRMLRSGECAVNVWIYRARKQFLEAGFLRPDAIIERRNGALRIGGRRVHVRGFDEKPSAN